MKDSSFFLFFVLFVSILSVIIVPFAYALEINSYFEENIICGTTTTSFTVLNVTDSTDFDFQNGSDYLIVASSSWGGDNNAHTYEISLLHNSTIFEGSQQIIEPQASNAVCALGNDSYRYMFWTVWSPSTALEASQDILLEYTSLDGSAMLFDDATIFVMELDELTENLEWFLDERTEDETLSFRGSSAPEATFIGSAIDGEFTEQPAKFFLDDTNENQDGFVDCIRVFDVALNSTTANLITNSTDTCFAFPDTSIPVPIRIYDLNGNATDLKGGSDIVLSDGGTGLTATGWNFLKADDAQIVASDIPNEVYAIEMVFNFTKVSPVPRVLDFHNNEGAFNGEFAGFGLYTDVLGGFVDGGIWFFDIARVLGVDFGGDEMIDGKLTHILVQRNSTGFFEAYKDGELAFAFDDTGTKFQTDSSATLSFTPMNNDDDWLILGEGLLAVEDLANQYETRLNFNNETFTPLLSREGEDVAEQVLQSFSRVFTLNNTQVHNFKLESQNDVTPVGTNERLYNSLFALNLNQFVSHNSTYIESALLIDDSGGNFGFTPASIEITSNSTGNWFIMGGFEKEGSKKMTIRMQVENNTGTLTDEPREQTTQEYEFSEGWDNKDMIANYFSTFENLNNNTHTINIDAGMDGNDKKDVTDRNIVAFTMELAIVVNVENPSDPISMIDNATFRINDLVDGNPLSMIENVTLTINDLIDGNPMSMLDNATFRINDLVDGNPLSMIENVTLTINDLVDGNPLSMIENVTLNIIQLEIFSDPISMIDDTTFGINDLVDGNPLSMIENVTLTINDLIDGNPMSMLDNLILNRTDLESPSDPISMLDDTVFDIFDLVDGNPLSMIENVTFTINNLVDGNPMSMVDDSTFSYNLFDADPLSMLDDTIFDIFDLVDGNPISMVDQVSLQIVFFITPPIVIPPTTGGGGVGGVGGQPVSNLIDSDDDGILDDVDDCPFEKETFNGFDDTDGCPDVIDLPEPITVADLGFPFEFNELSVIDDFVNLETDSPQPQVEDLGIRWLGDEPITITSINVDASPFEFQFENLPVEFGNNQIGFTQGQIIYTIQEPAKECTNVFSFDCVDNVTYDIPVTIQGEVRGKIVTAQGSIVVDNSNRFNPYWLVFIFMAMIIILALVFWRRRRNSAPPKTRTLLKVTEAKPTGRITETRKISRTGKGETRRILEGREKKKFLFKRR